MNTLRVHLTIYRLYAQNLLPRLVMGTETVSEAILSASHPTRATILDSTTAQRGQASNHWEESDIVRMSTVIQNPKLINPSSYVVPDAVVSGVHCKLYA